MAQMPFLSGAYPHTYPSHLIDHTQIDLAREASNLQRFNYNFRRTDNVRFPVPLYPLVSADVLVSVEELPMEGLSQIQSNNGMSPGSDITNSLFCLPPCHARSSPLRRATT